MPFGKGPLITCIINVGTASLQVICKGQSTLGKDKNSSEVSLFCQKKKKKRNTFNLDLDQGSRLMLSAFANHTPCTTTTWWAGEGHEHLYLRAPKEFRVFIPKNFPDDFFQLKYMGSW